MSTPPVGDGATGGPTGVLGGSFRAHVTAAGTVIPCDGSAPLAWHVAADDRWHSPEREAAVRQHRQLGAPVYETRVRIPGGDAVQRVWSVADGGGRTLVEVTNESPLPIACAFTRRDLLTARPPADVPVEGIDLPASAIVLPIGHRASVTAALAHDRPVAGLLPGGSSAAATARGWAARSEAASRVVLPDERSAERLVAARADLLLSGPPDAAEDPAGHLLAQAERERLGELVGRVLDDGVPDVAAAVQAVARRTGWDADAALAAAAWLLARAGEARALRDLERIRAGRPLAGAPDGDAVGPRAVAAVERRLAADGVVLPAGLPTTWLGRDFEAHGLPIGPSSSLSFAVRWHGKHAAVLWEVDGEPVDLRAPAVDRTWRTREQAGEALWRLSAG